MHDKKSSGKLIAVNTNTWTASLIQAFHAPDDVVALSQGSTPDPGEQKRLHQLGVGRAITEFSPNGTVLFHAYLDSGELWGQWRCPELPGIQV